MNIQEVSQALAEHINNLDIESKINAINQVREAIHNVSPFKSEPVDCVKWVKNTTVQANDYNPNAVAPPEMELLHISIAEDGYTQPIVAWDDDEKDGVTVIDGFHRHRVGKEYRDVTERVHGYLPIVVINDERSSRNDRIASTIRHNRARGKHQIDAMSEIVIELKNRNWANKRIARELGMDEEEVLRLCQISGLEDLFSDNDFSRAWEADDSVDDWEPVTDDVTDDDLDATRIPHEKNNDRIFHTYDKWECHKAGFYAQSVEGKKATELHEDYRDFLADIPRFEAALQRVIKEWPNSCEHYLTNFAMNRIAWLGQASMCIDTGVPSKFCAGYNLLSDEQKDAANASAHMALNQWLDSKDMPQVTLEEAMGGGRQVEIY